MAAQPLPSAARLVPLTWLTDTCGFDVRTACTITDVVAEALEHGHVEDAHARARLILTRHEAEHLVDLILNAAARLAPEPAVV